MLVIRATQKLLTHLGPPVIDPPPSTTVLGDWYAKPFDVAKRHLVLLVSEKSRMAVLMPGEDVAAVPLSFPDVLASQLERLGVPQDAIDREIAAAREIIIAGTANKSLLDTLNDYVAMTKHRFRDLSDVDLDAESLSLSDTPPSPLGHRFASDVALELFGIEPSRSRAVLTSATAEHQKA